MKKVLISGLLFISLIILPLLMVCEETAILTPSAAFAGTAALAATGESNWWDKFGEPQYGGTITVRTPALVSSFDVNILAAQQTWLYWWEQLFIYDLTVSPDIWSFNTLTIIPDQYFKGCLAESWKMSDATTLTVKIREGIRYANKPPANGREFTAHDVQYHYDRMLGTGSGFTKPMPGWSMYFDFLKKVTATDKYTVIFEFSKPSALNFNSLVSMALGNMIVCQENVELSGGTITDWKTAVGTGPWILTDFISGSSMTYSRNPDYWDYDERHPDKRLPYANAVKALVIPDMSTALAALRTGKIDALDVEWIQVQTLKKSNPKLKQASFPKAGPALIFRYDNDPFNDIRVRKALQMAMNLPQIAHSHYGGTIDPIPAGPISQFSKGYCFPYEEWPQELKDEYSYNPERAKALLAEAGYPDGFKANCVAAANSDIELLEIMKAYLMDIGVDMEINTMDWITWGNYVRTGSHESFVMSPFGNSGGQSGTDYVKGHMRNYGRVSEPELETLIADYWAATEFSQLAQISRQIDTICIEKHINVQTFGTYNYLMYQPYLKGYNGESTIVYPAPFGWALARLWIDEDK